MARREKSPEGIAAEDEARQVEALTDLSASPVLFPLSSGETVEIKHLRARQFAEFARLTQPIRSAERKRDREEKAFLRAQSAEFHAGIADAEKRELDAEALPEGVSAEYRAGYEWRKSQEDSYDFLELISDHAESVFGVVQLCTGLKDEAVDEMDTGELSVLYAQCCKVNGRFFAQGLLASTVRAIAAGLQITDTETPTGFGSKGSNTYATTDTAVNP